MKLTVIFVICMSCVAAEPGLLSSVSDNLEHETLLGTGIRLENLINKSKQTQHSFTWKQVAQYDGKNGAPLYIVIDGMVYDVTEFTQYHPAGPDVLKKYGGKDATAAFYASGMSAEVISNILPLFQVGKIRLIMGDVKRYTFAEVTSRDGNKGQPLWVVYKDSVYDLTKYIDEHPGGYDTIMEEAGKDATRAFEDVGHSSDARNILLKHKIGEIVEEEKRYDANGKKKKRVITVKPDDKPTSRSCLGVITCGLLG